MNRYATKGTSSKYKGVTFNKQAKKWRAQIVLSGKFIHLGTFDSEKNAALTYNRAATKLFGGFARLNNI